MLVFWQLPITGSDLRGLLSKGNLYAVPKLPLFQVKEVQVHCFVKQVFLEIHWIWWNKTNFNHISKKLPLQVIKLLRDAGALSVSFRTVHTSVPRILRTVWNRREGLTPNPSIKYIIRKKERGIIYSGATFKGNYELKIMYLYIDTSHLHITGWWTYLCILSWPEGTTPTLATFTTFWRITEEVKFCGATMIIAEVSFIPVSIPIRAKEGPVLQISLLKLH